VLAEERCSQQTASQNARVGVPIMIATLAFGIW
jgi:hypothetical protein